MHIGPALFATSLSVSGLPCSETFSCRSWLGVIAAHGWLTSLLASSGSSIFGAPDPTGLDVEVEPVGGRSVEGTSVARPCAGGLGRLVSWLEHPAMTIATMPITKPT